MKPTIATLDFEGVFTPEIWIEFARKTAIPALERTTRDEPDYDKLMHYRIDILRQHNLRLADIQAVIASMNILPGARDFLDWLRSRLPVIILSDTFYEFAMPLLSQLGYPTLLCHNLEIDERGMISGYRLRLPDSKRAAILALKQLNLSVIAVGDSYNDTSMLTAADHGILFRPPANVITDFPQFPVVHHYADLQSQMESYTVLN